MGHANTLGPLPRETGLIEDQHAIARRRLLDHHGNPLAVHGCLIPGALRQQTIDRRLGQARYRFGDARTAFPGNVSQQTGGITLQNGQTLAAVEMRPKWPQKILQFRNRVGRDTSNHSQHSLLPIVYHKTGAVVLARGAFHLAIHRQ